MKALRRGFVISMLAVGLLFPKVIAYTRKADGTLEARASDGVQRGETFSFRLVKG